MSIDAVFISAHTYRICRFGERTSIAIDAPEVCFGTQSRFRVVWMLFILREARRTLIENMAHDGTHGTKLTYLLYMKGRTLIPQLAQNTLICSGY